MHWSGLRPSSSLGSDHQMMESRVLGCLLEHTQLGSCVWGTGPCVSVFIHPFCHSSILLGISISCDSGQGRRAYRD